MIEKYSQLTAVEIVELIKSHKIKAIDLTETALQLAENEGRQLNAVITVCTEKALAQAKKIDHLSETNVDLPLMAGVPVIVKDNIVYSGYPTTCGSRLLENYVPPYDATCIEKLEKAGAIIIAKANMDEFAMGSSNENSAFGPVANPVGDDLVPGGSSGGSCAAVAAGIVPIAYGSDTGGSIRQPAGFCGVVGLKPTYGAVSRYGLVAFASSTDQIGPVSRNVADCALAFEAIAGHDPHDATSVESEHLKYSAVIAKDKYKKFNFGIPKAEITDGIDREIVDILEAVVTKLKSDGHKINEISLPHNRHAIAAYYIIANAEASSNLARFDGVRFGKSAGRNQGLAEMYATTRGENFGPEVKRRIMLGTYALSAGYYDAYYDKAQKVRQLIRDDYEMAFNDVDLIITPTSPTPAFKLGEKADDPLAMYLSDILTTPASLAGLPAISVPCGCVSDGRPVGLQITGPAFSEEKILAAAGIVEQLMGDGYAEY